MMDEVVALSSMLRARHLQSQPTSTRLDDIPSLTRSLPQIAADSTRLLSARVAATSPTTTPSVSVHPAALRLFASVGFDSDALRRAVASVPTAASFVDIPVRPPGTHRHLASIPPRALDDARLRTNAALATAAHDELVSDLKAANERLLSRLAPLVKPGTRTTSSSTSQWLTPGKERDRSNGDAALAVALSVDVRYVDAVRGIALHGDAHSAPFLMHEAAAAVQDAPHFVEALAVLASVARHAQEDTPPPSHLAVWGARAVLEDQFAERIPELPQKPRLAAAAAVVPAVTEYVRTLQKDRKLNVGIRAKGRGEREMVALWPRVFYCMRVGHVEAALVVLKGADARRYPEAEQVSPFFERFLAGRERARMKFWRTQHGGEDEMQDQIEDGGVPMSPGILAEESEYGSLASFYAEASWPSDDRYMRACIVLLMRLELLPSHDDVMQGIESSKPPHPTASKGQLCSLAFPDEDMFILFGSVEDYMWLRLWLCRTPLETGLTSSLSNFNVVTLQEVQGNILSCGHGHFDPDGHQPLLYAFVLSCCGLYEKAVSYLTSHANEHFMHSGVHMALVIYHLRWMKDEQAFHSILMRYVSLFSRLFPTEAALYLLTIRDREALGQYLRDLIVTTGEYDTLLGTAGEEGARSGSLANLLSSASAPLPSGFSAEDLEHIRLETALFAASEAASRGEFAKAAALYKSAGRLAHSAEMTMKNLADVVDEHLSPKRSLAVAEGRTTFQALNANGIPSAPRYVVTSLDALLQMSAFFEEYWAGRYQTAWDALRGVGVIPLNSSDIANCRRDLAGSMEKFDPCLQRCSIELLKLALNIAEFALEQGHVQSHEAPRGQGNSSPHAPKGNPSLPYKSEIKTLCMFAGYVRISELAVNEQLVRIEMLLSR